MHFVQRIYSSFEYVPVLEDVDRVIQNISSKLESKLNEAFAVLNRTRTVIENYFYSHNKPYMHSAIVERFKFQNVLTEYEVFQVKGILNNSYSEENFTADLGKSTKTGASIKKKLSLLKI